MDIKPKTNANPNSNPNATNPADRNDINSTNFERRNYKADIP